ncbi:hypothetical protein BKA62DRAFT_831686 [Auriculariales sp. MPI-PUGE-AT-0066]|nr:hypothetical protein BKA62DRAFT_831686 [Auriculariales sp. MPI-PUGE-AT-0066]
MYSESAPPILSTNWPSPLVNLPFELLQEVFSHVAHAADDPWDEHKPPVDCDVPRARVPYLLARIYSKWREIALHTPSIWTYIYAGDCSDPTRDYVATNLDRSSQMPLCIFFTYTDSNLNNAHEMLCNIELNGHRWRRFRLHLPTDIQISIKLLLQSTPLLEELIVSQPHGSDSSYIERFSLLPASPRLRRLVCGPFRIVPAAQWPNLDYLNINLRGYSYAALWDTLAHTPSLRELHVFFPFSEAVTPQTPAPSQDINLPLLETLGIFGHPCHTFCAWTHYFKFPRLNRLVVSTYCCYILGDFFDQFVSQIKYFKLQYELSSHLSRTDGAALVQLKGLEELEICAVPVDCDAAQWRSLDVYMFFDSFFEGPDGAAPLLRELRRLVLDRVVLDDLQWKHVFLMMEQSRFRDSDPLFECTVTGPIPYWVNERFAAVAQAVRITLKPEQ